MTTFNGRLPLPVDEIVVALPQERWPFTRWLRLRLEYLSSFVHGNLPTVTAAKA